MKKLIARLLLVAFCVMPLMSCSEDAEESSGGETTTKSQTQVNDPSPTKSEESVAPGIEAPEGWPKDVPTPLTGEVLFAEWMPDGSFYTVDIRYSQAEIDAYGERLQDAGFIKVETDKYEGIYGDSTAYVNDKWEVVLADEVTVRDYTFIGIHPVE